MQPVLQAGVYVYVVLPDGSSLPSQALCMFREPEGVTVILEKTQAQALSLEYSFECAWIGLTVHSSLEAVGLTAAFASALTQAGISCNVVAAFYHDHIFVPVEKAQAAMKVLQNLSQSRVM